MGLYKNKDKSLIKLSTNIIVDLKCVDLQCTIVWITWRFSLHVDLQCVSIYSM